MNQGEGHKGTAGRPCLRPCNVFETGFKPCVPEGLHQQEAGPNSLLFNPCILQELTGRWSCKIQYGPEITHGGG